MRPRPCSTQAVVTDAQDDGSGDVGWKEPRDSEVGHGDRLGHRSDNLELNAEKLRRKQSKAKGMNILNGLNLADYNTWTMNLAISFLAA